MESAQKEVISALLACMFSRGLISQFTYSKAEDLVHSVMDFPKLLWYPVCLTKEAGTHEYSQDPQ